MTKKIGNAPGRTREVEKAPLLLAPEETLVADPRGTLTPAQMVQDKLLSLLQTGGTFSAAAAGRLHDIRQRPGAR